MYRLALLVLLTGCATATERIASSTNEIHGLARSSGRRFEVIHSETGKLAPSIPTIRTEAEIDIDEQEEIMGLVDAVQVYLMNTTNITPWWASLLTYSLIFGSVACVAFLVWHLGFGRFIRGWLGLVTPTERRAAELTASLIDLTPEQAVAAVAELRNSDPTFDAAFRRAAPIRTPRRLRKRKQ